MKRRANWEQVKLPLVVFLVLAIVLAACGTDDGDESSGETAAAGSDEDDAESLSQMPETRLTVQSLYGPEEGTSRAFQAWGEAVEDATDGRMTFEIVYGSAMADPLDIEEALSSGLLDIAMNVPIYSPAAFPIDGVVQDLSSVGEQSPVVGLLQGLGAHTEAGYDPFYQDPMIDQGLVPILPFVGSGIAGYYLVCKDEPVRSLDEASGKRARAAGETYAGEAEALGMSPVSLPITEAYEAMQRGVIDCNIENVPNLIATGTIETVDHWTGGDLTFSGLSGVNITISGPTWDALPVEAQRLLWDTAIDVWLRTFVEAVLVASAEALNEASEVGVEFHEWDDEARAALDQHQRQVAEAALADADTLGDGGPEFAQKFLDLHEQWLDTVHDLGYSDEEHPTLVAFAEANPTGEVDVAPFIESLKEAIWEYRP